MLADFVHRFKSSTCLIDQGHLPRNDILKAVDRKTLPTYMPRARWKRSRYARMWQDRENRYQIPDQALHKAFLRGGGVTRNACIAAARGCHRSPATTERGVSKRGMIENGRFRVYTRNSTLAGGQRRPY